LTRERLSFYGEKKKHVGRLLFKVVFAEGGGGRGGGTASPYFVENGSSLL